MPDFTYQQLGPASLPIFPHPSGKTSEGQLKTSFEEVESSFLRCMEGPLERARQIGHADIVVGIPFYNEADTLPHVLRTAIKGLRKYYPDAKCVLVAAGSPMGEDALRSVLAMPIGEDMGLIAFILSDKLLNGKGWSIRAIFEVADRLGADLALLEADLKSRHGKNGLEGFSPEWVRLLLEPIRNDQFDMVISRFHRHHLEAPVSFLTYPLFSSLYHCPIRRLTGGQWGMAHDLFAKYRANTRQAWYNQISGYGVDAWLVAVAITNEARICEANMGVKVRQRSRAKAELVLRQVVQALFDQILDDRRWWGQFKTADALLSGKSLPSFGLNKGHESEPGDLGLDRSVAKFRDGWSKFHHLYEQLLPEDTFRELNRLAVDDFDGLAFSSKSWAQAVYSMILAYAFNKNFARDDIVSSVIPLYRGFEAGYLQHLQVLGDKLRYLDPDEVTHLLSIESEDYIVEGLLGEFLKQKSGFLARWEDESAALRPPVPAITYREFIPGVPLIVPSELFSASGDLITANGIYEAVFARQKAQFEQFVHERLNIPRTASSLELTLAVKDFLHSVEEQLFSESEISTVRGTRKLAGTIFKEFPHGGGFALTDEAASRLLAQSPPLTLITKSGYTNLTDLLRVYKSTDIMALSAWAETREYTDRLWAIMSQELQPEDFAPKAVGFIVVRHEDLPSLVELRESSALDKLTATIVVSNLHKGMGGEFPKLRYFTTIAKDIVEAERFGKIWQRFAESRKDFGKRVINSIRGHFGSDPLSAHNIFEDGNQRILVDRLRQMANTLWDKAGDDEPQRQMAAKLAAVADSYQLALVLPDNKFVTCSAWSWASYSFKGGKSAPPPLSVHVERDWASREFLVEYYKALGGTETAVEEKIIELMAEGREPEDLAPILLGREKDAHSIIPSSAVALVPKSPLAGQLERVPSNPLLRPISTHWWESKYVLNAGAIKLDGKVYLAYRAFGDDSISRLGLAASQDGFTFTERLPMPIFEPTGKHDTAGCEDPRLTLIGDRLYMAYTIFDGRVAQIALASIHLDDFVAYRWKGWQRHGRVFPSFTDKDAVLFPQTFGGRYALLHRVDPHIWITFSSHLRCPWSRKKHKILAGSTSGMMWDGHKIGAGAQPLPGTGGC